MVKVRDHAGREATGEVRKFKTVRGYVALISFQPTVCSVTLGLVIHFAEHLLKARIHRVINGVQEDIEF